MSFASPEYLDKVNVRETNYETQNYEKSREKKTKKLTQEVRKLCQSIHSLKPLDKDWKEMSLNLKRLTEIAFNEKAALFMNNEDDENMMQSTTTLWDNNDDYNDSNNNLSLNECVVRLLLEEGKLNLLLRLLTNFKYIEFKDNFKVSMEIECNKNKIRMSSLLQLCLIYEQSLGILLFFCIERIESLQILDSEHLISYISDVLNKKNNVFRMQKDRMTKFYKHLFSNDKRQEILIIYYLYILSKYFNKISFEEKLMSLIEKYQIIQKSINYISKYHQILSLDVIQKYTLFLNNCFQTESFSAEPHKFILNEDNDEENNDEENNDNSSTPKLLCQFYQEYVERFLKKDKIFTMKQVRGFMKQYMKLKKM